MSELRHATWRLINPEPRQLSHPLTPLAQSRTRACTHSPILLFNHSRGCTHRCFHPLGTSRILNPVRCCCCTQLARSTVINISLCTQMRLAQARSILEALGPSCILVGDLNMRNAEDSSFEELGLTDSWKMAGKEQATKNTWDSNLNKYHQNGFGFACRFDRAYIRGLTVVKNSFELVGQSSVPPSASHFLSDHFGISLVVSCGGPKGRECKEKDAEKQRASVMAMASAVSCESTDGPNAFAASMGGLSVPVCAVEDQVSQQIELKQRVRITKQTKQTGVVKQTKQTGVVRYIGAIQ